MHNRETHFTRDYHRETSHSPESVRNSRHFLDWSNQPRPFKLYRGTEIIQLPKDPDSTGRPALAVLGLNAGGQTSAPVTLNDLASILYFSAGITRRRSYPAGEFLFRAAACTGALYSIELYVICESLDGLDAGVYHFDPARFVLNRIRSGDLRGVLDAATSGQSDVRHAPATVVCTGTYWRNAWKYQARTYRHFGWDTGTILANLLAVACARNLPARVVSGFVDQEVNFLLGVDADREVALSLVPLGYSDTPAPTASAGTLAPVEFETVPYSPSEVDYPAMREVHAASSLATPEEVAAWRNAGPSQVIPDVRGRDGIALDPLPATGLPEDPVEVVIRRRGSSRSFNRNATISFREFSTALYLSTQGIPGDFVPPGSQLNDLYLIVHAVEGIEPGAYVLHRNPWTLELLKKGTFRQEAGYLGLEQQLPADCCAVVFFLADLHPILERFGNRGYRAAQLEAGIIGGRLYLSAYAQRLGATGLTFYDDEVTRFFSPHAAGKSAIFLVALGRTEKVSRRTG
jgi:SagB-type dehydrogenase family enzyme